MALPVYFLGLLLSIVCSILLFKSYTRTNARITFWSGWGFVGFAVNNALLILDKTTGPTFDLSIVRTIPSFFGVTLLLYGLITDTVLE